jgi:hypothetical protein
LPNRAVTILLEDIQARRQRRGMEVTPTIFRERDSVWLQKKVQDSL